MVFISYICNNCFIKRINYKQCLVCVFHHYFRKLYIVAFLLLFLCLIQIFNVPYSIN